ncbi:hypothetical protein [Pontibacter ramchanderi]|uniref:Uncharacterized protein n=1 Tax=Pontibacter ramchanderi TaxID=1179743 RepID=A0A2N3V0Y1_9BACT|nr:hypothetical protein [Pontibacter ramchanderi]PKV75291.1 hypothetical protein BD749_0229 [Pontibacter ramchanderi]
MSLTVEEMLRLYYNKYKELERKGGPEKDGDLFEEVIGLEEGILEKFGLPASNTNKEILWKLSRKKKISDKSIDLTLLQLKAAAEKHLYAPVLTDLEQLQKAKAQNRSAFDILPELGHPTHEYTILLYDTILDYVSPKLVLAELSALKRLDCYGEIATLKNQYPRTFRKTKVYKQHKPYLKFLDIYLDPLNIDLLYNLGHDETIVGYPHPLVYAAIAMPPEFEEREDNRQANLFDSVRPEAIEFNPEYITLIDLIVIEEIIFSEDSAVTVVGHIAHAHYPQPITLGFEFDALTSLIQDYGSHGQYILSYFNKQRQLNLIDSPTIISLKDKTGSNLGLNKHYLKVYKPLTLGPSGKPEVMKEAFYIVDEVIDRARYDQEQIPKLKCSLNGAFHHMLQHYYFYLNALLKGMNDAEARKKSGLEDNTRFEVSRLLYMLYKHGETPEMR